MTLSDAQDWADYVDRDYVNQGSPANLDYLTNVSEATPSDGQALVYDATAGNWKPGTVASGGGSGIVNNRIDGDLTIGEDDSEMLTIASKLHIPGGKSGQVLTKGTDGSIEYGPTSFPSVTLPNDKQLQHKTLTGTQDISVTAGSLADFNDGTGALEVTLTPSVSSAQVLVTVNANVGLSNDTLLTLEKTVGTNAPTIVGNDHPFISNQCNFKFIDTLTDQTAVTYKTKVKNPSSQNVSVLLASTSALFDDNSFKFMWQAGKDKTVGIEYDVTAVGPTNGLCLCQKIVTDTIMFPRKEGITSK